MWVLKIGGVDSSCHTHENDANDQKALFIALGTNENDITIVEQDSYSPVA